MTAPAPILQLLIQRTATGPTVVARTEGIPFAFEEFALRTTVAYGDRPADSPGFEAVFALPADPEYVAVGTVAAPHDASVGYFIVLRFLFVARPLYEAIRDPFGIAAKFPVNTGTRGRLESLEWTDTARPRRMVKDVQRVLKSGDSPLLLGAVQALLDGATLRIRKTKPDREFIRGLWQLLPDSSRADLWPCEYCFQDELPFRLAVLHDSAKANPRAMGEEQAKDYPEGRYESALQVAAEAGDQVALDQLFARQSPRAVLRMALALILFALVMLFVTKFLK